MGPGRGVPSDIEIRATALWRPLFHPRMKNRAKASVPAQVGEGLLFTAQQFHSISALTIRQKLKAIVLDHAPICAMASEFADKYDGHGSVQQPSPVLRTPGSRKR
jgi:hypothetical protein